MKKLLKKALIFKRKREKLKNSIQRKKVKLDKLDNSFQESCPHPKEYVIKVRAKTSDWLMDLPPFKVCKLCGFAEEGWSYDYITKDYDVPELDRELAYRYVVGRVCNYRDKERMKYPERFNEDGSRREED